MTDRDASASHEMAQLILDDPDATDHEKNVAELTMKRHAVTARLKGPSGEIRKRMLRTRMAQEAFTIEGEE